MPAIAGLDPVRLNDPQTATIAQAFVLADTDLRNISEMPADKNWLDAYGAALCAYRQALKALHDAEDAMPGEAQRGMAVKSVFDEISARGLQVEGSYTLCAYRSRDHRRVDGPYMFAAHLVFDSLAAAIAFTEAQIIAPEHGFLPWRVEGGETTGDLVAAVSLKVDHDLASPHRRMYLTANGGECFSRWGLSVSRATVRSLARGAQPGLVGSRHELAPCSLC